MHIACGKCSLVGPVPRLSSHAGSAEHAGTAVVVVLVMRSAFRWAAASVLVVALGATASSHQTVRLSRVMREKLGHTQAVLGAVITSDWKTLEEHALALRLGAAAPGVGSRVDRAAALQEARIDKRLQHTGAELRLEVEEPRGLRQRQSQARHLVVFSPRAQADVVRQQRHAAPARQRLCQQQGAGCGLQATDFGPDLACGP